jgi:DNA adenine methylase
MQMKLFDDINHLSSVNVASVPQLSPFRYPGGKTWLVPQLRHWLASPLRQRLGILPVRPTVLIEPFAGGGSVSLTAVVERLVDHVIMVELDEDVAAVWQTILDEEQSSWLTHEIETFEVTLENVEQLLARTEITCRERAFRTVLRNRVNRGGILAPGAGLLKKGENGKGLLSRWYPETLKKRIERIHQIRDRITFIYGDGIEIMRRYIDDPDAVFFIDPPYTVAGKKAGSRLYTHFTLNHTHLFDLAQNLRGDFLMTYDNVQEVHMLAQSHHFEARTIPMRNTHHAEVTELLIGPDLHWLA